MKASFRNLNRPTQKPIVVDYCASFLAKFKGLMFQKEIEPYSGVVLVESRDSVVNTTIHMLFMNFDICVIWINNDGKVVDTKIAKRWHLAYKPEKPASFVLELHPKHMKDFLIGDKVEHEIH